MSRKLKEGDIVLISSDLFGIKPQYGMIVENPYKSSHYIHVLKGNGEIWPALESELELIENPSELLKEFLTK